MRSGLDSSREISLNHIYRDVGSFGQRTRKFLSNGENAALLMGGLAGVAFIMPAISELAFAGALGNRRIQHGRSAQERPAHAGAHVGQHT